MHRSLSISTENLRKLEVFYCFQGGCKGVIGMKRFKVIFETSVSSEN